MPVVALSFADVKAEDLPGMLKGVREVVADAFDAHDHLRSWGGLTRNERIRLDEVRPDMDAATCARSLGLLC